MLLFTCAVFASAPVTAQVVTTLTTSLGVNGDGIVAAPSGDLYVAGGGASDVVLRITPSGTVSTFVDGIASPVGIFRTSAGNFFVNNYRANSVTRISASGEASLFATDLNGPAGLVVNDRGGVLVTEFGANFVRNGAAVQELSTDGAKKVHIKGSGLRDPIGIAIDEDENLYIANWKSGEIYKSNGRTLTLFARVGGTVNQIAYANGSLYVPSPSLRKIFRIGDDGAVTHIAGTGAHGAKDGPALQATFGRPNSVAVGRDETMLYIIDADAQAIRVLELERRTGEQASEERMNPRSQCDGTLTRIHRSPRCISNSG